MIHAVDICQPCAKVLCGTSRFLICYEVISAVAAGQGKSLRLSQVQPKM